MQARCACAYFHARAHAVTLFLVLQAEGKCSVLMHRDPSTHKHAGLYFWEGRPRATAPHELYND
eukprot:1157805-Pelagomonas_calceolata.AAC.15